MRGKRSLRLRPPTALSGFPECFAVVGEVLVLLLLLLPSLLLCALCCSSCGEIGRPLRRQQGLMQGGATRTRDSGRRSF